MNAFFSFLARGVTWVERVEIPPAPASYPSQGLWRDVWLRLWRQDRTGGGCSAFKPLTEDRAVGAVAHGATPFKWDGQPA